MPLAVAREVPPTFLSSPEAVSSFGAEAVDLAASAGLILDPWQVTALDYILGEDVEGRPAAFEAAVIVPRQNGKGSILEALSLAWLFLTDAPLILHSAHEFKTAAEAFRRLRTLIQGAPHLDRRVEKVTTAAGNEAIELTSGQRIRYVARSKGSGRGFTAGKVLLDEAYALSAEEMAALLPTLATQPDAQLVYTSSAGMSSSDHLRSVRDRGRKGGDPGLCYLEWGGVVSCREGCGHALDDEACGLNDEATWQAANPSMGIAGHGIPRRHVANERRAWASTPHLFLRERLGVWDEASSGSSGFTVVDWAACADESAQTGTGATFALDLSWDRRHGSVAVASRLADGNALVELVARPSGSDALVDTCERLMRANPDASWTAPDTPAIQSILGRLRDVGLVPRLLPPREVEAAHGNLQDAVKQQTLVHLGDEDLSVALAGAQRRDTESGWVFTRRRSDVDISPLYAVLSALWEVSQGGPSDVF